MTRASRHRVRSEIRGAVQGVGFRPFVYRLASELDLCGWVQNDSRGVYIEVEGSRDQLESFLERLPVERPPMAILHSLETAWLEPVGYLDFQIRHSDEEGVKSAVVLPDLATCEACLAEVLDPADSRFRYPFTNCTNCGPRFTIVRSLPYDRPNTTMASFRMCASCSREYRQPDDRRFHAQPNACPECGPQLSLWDRAGGSLAAGDAALVQAAAELRRGRILALKGLGGFHLVADARCDETVSRLRRRKARPHKPLAVMVANVEQARSICEVPAAAEAVLIAPEAPIVLLPRLDEAYVTQEVAPGNPYLGVMVPYTPLHHLLLREVGFPLVATSGNLSDEPICIDNREALERLGTIADLFLVHDRPIARHADDSVVLLLDGAPRLLRRARGYAPLPVVLRARLPAVLAVGAHLKNAVALCVEGKVFVSQHIGDMEAPESLNAYARVISDLLRLYEAEPVAVAHDLHPDYPSTRWANDATAGRLTNGEPGSAPEIASLAGARRVAVQHHHAHLAACLAENDIEGRALGVIWDGTGYGPDGTVWGGEFLLGNAAGYARVARLRPFRLPGGEAAIREPRRVATALLWELYGEAVLGREELAPIGALSAQERALLGQMLARGFRCPETTSAGRLFDAIAALIGLHQRVSFEGQAAMALEFAADSTLEESYPVALTKSGPMPEADAHQNANETSRASALEVDWAPLVEAVLEDSRRGVARDMIAARFHNALVESIVEVARVVGEPRVALTGGCFQNRLLTERASRRLRRAGFQVLLHRQVPPNDGGISLGQVAVAGAQLQNQS